MLSHNQGTLWSPPHEENILYFPIRMSPAPPGPEFSFSFLKREKGNFPVFPGILNYLHIYADVAIPTPKGMILFPS